MKPSMTRFAFLLSVPLMALGGSTSPIGKVIDMLADLEQKIIAEGEGAQKTYEEFSEWCEDRASNLGHEIKTGQAESESLKAAIASEASNIESLQAKIEDLSASIDVDEADLKAATKIRATEEEDFRASETELVDTLSMLERAVGILEREMAKGGASMLQLKNVESITQALTIMVKASVMDSADAGRLTALLQGSQQSEDEDSEAGAPAADVYKGHSGDIIDTLNGLKETAEAQLSDARKKETANVHNFEMLKQSLTDEIKFGNKDMEAAKKAKAASAESKATAEGELAVTLKDLAADEQTKAELHHDCMTKASDFEAATKSRNEELTALADAKKVLKENTGAAGEISYGLNQVSFFQSSLSSGADLAAYSVVRMVRDLARTENSPALAQLAQRLTVAMHSGMNTGADPFAKIKGLISDMIDRLEAEASADATKKAYCDKELSETNEKKSDKTAEIAKQTTRIDKMKARSAVLKEEVADLQNALAKLAAAQASMNKLREEEHAAFVSNKADMEQGLKGVKMALQVLNEYYASEGKAHDAAEGAGKSIVSLLEVVESDFTKQLAEIVSTEELAASTYTRETKDNEIEKTAKDKDVDYKSKESAYLDKESAELSADREGVQAELDAVLEYLAKIEEECIAKAETYAERKRRYAAEIAGLKEALRVLEDETAFVQRRSLRHRFVRAHVPQ